MFKPEPPRRGRRSRAEIETLCILDAVGARGCQVTDVAERLGLSATLSAAIADGLEPLLTGGLLEQDDESVKLTAAGRLMLAEVL